MKKFKNYLEKLLTNLGFANTINNYIVWRKN